MRLTRGPAIRAVLDARCSVADDLFVLYVLPNDVGHPRLAFLAGKKHGNAVQRNRIKRRIREAFRMSRESLPADLDLAVIPRVRAAVPDPDAAARSLTSLARRAEIKSRRRREQAAGRPG